MGKRAGQQIYVEIPIGAGLDRLWQLSQDPVLHPRWDLRFTAIRHIGSGAGTNPSDSQPINTRAPDSTQQFRYELGLPLHTIRGTGTSLGSRRSPDGSATSVLKFTTSDILSPIGSGTGYWRYLPFDGGIRFITGYNYQPGWGVAGKVLDARLIRPALGWATAISFDRLRLWAEHDVDPGTARNAWLADAAARAAGTGLAAFLLATAGRRILGTRRSGRRRPGTRRSGKGRSGEGNFRSSMSPVALAAGLIAVARWYPASDQVPRAARCTRTAQSPAARRPPAALATLPEPE